MSYRIQVDSAAGSLLRDFSPHVVLRIGRALADLAAALTDGEEPEETVLHVDDCVLQFVIDRAHRLLQVIHIEQRVELAEAFADAHP